MSDPSNIFSLVALDMSDRLTSDLFGSTPAEQAVYHALQGLVERWLNERGVTATDPSERALLMVGALLPQIVDQFLEVLHTEMGLDADIVDMLQEANRHGPALTLASLAFGR